MPIQRRYALKSKEAKQIIDQINQTLKLDFDKDTRVEVVVSDVGEIYLIESKPLLFKSNDRILPTLLFNDFIAKASKAIVDMVIPCSSADLANSLNSSNDPSALFPSESSRMCR